MTEELNNYKGKKSQYHKLISLFIELLSCVMFLIIAREENLIE